MWVYIRKSMDVSMSQLRSSSVEGRGVDLERERERMSREKMKRVGMGLKKGKPYLLMIGLQFGMAGNYIFGKDILNHGMSRFVFIVYRNAMAATFLAPFAFFVERSQSLQFIHYILSCCVIIHTHTHTNIDV